MGYTIGQIKMALEKAGGLQTLAAQNLKITRAAVSKRVKESPTLQRAIIDIKEGLLDMSEAVFIHHINKKNLKAAETYLEKHGKDRGWGREIKIDNTHEFKGGVLKVPGLIDPDKWNEIAKDHGASNGDKTDE